MLLVASVVGLLLAADRLLPDGIDGSVLPLFMATDTQYAPGYTRERFRELRPGMAIAEVDAMLGEPVFRLAAYSSRGSGCGSVRFSSGVVTEVTDTHECTLPAISIGMRRTAVLLLRGAADRETCAYSWSPTNASFHERSVVLIHQTVTEKIARFYVD